MYEVEIYSKDDNFTDFSLKNINSIIVEQLSFTDENMTEFRYDGDMPLILIGDDQIHYVAPGIIGRLTIKKSS